MAGARRRILVVEDDSETAEQLVESLVTSGYQVDLAIDGNDGLSRGRTADYAVMTIDRMLPGMDGLAIIRRLREDGITTPALIISALGEIDLIAARRERLHELLGRLRIVFDDENAAPRCCHYFGSPDHVQHPSIAGKSGN